MLHRLYLSLLWLLIAFGVCVTGAVALTQAHDHVVVSDDRACFLAAVERRDSETSAKVAQVAAASARMDAVRPGEELDEADLLRVAQAAQEGCDEWEDGTPFTAEDCASVRAMAAEEAAKTMAAACNVRPHTIGADVHGAAPDALVSARAWFAPSLTFSFSWAQVAMALFAFLPAVLLIAGRRWWRWVRGEVPVA